MTDAVAGDEVRCRHCGSTRIHLRHTDRKRIVKCKACGAVETEVYGRHRAGKSEDSHAIEEARG